MVWRIFAVCAMILPLAESAEGSIRVGVVSDLHMTAAPASAECFERALRCFDEENVWQGGFTAVEAPSLSCCLAGVEGTSPERFLKAQPVRQFYVVEFAAGRLMIERRACDFEFKEIGTPWAVKVPEGFK